MKMAKSLVVILAIIGIIALGGVYVILSQNQPSSDTSNGSNNPPILAPSNNPPASTTKSEEPVSTPKTHNIDIKNFAFSPAEIRIMKGDSVIWTNKDSAGHTVTSDSGDELNSGTLSNGESYTHTFNTAGTFNYHCVPHKSIMKAKIIVE